MHEDQVDLSVGQVVDLVRRVFPQWAGLPVTRVSSSGTVSALFRLGDGLVARFWLELRDPGELEADVLREAEAARWLAGVSPVPTPRPVGLARVSADNPFPWAVYTWVRGTVATEVDVAGSAVLARDLAGFVNAMRAQPTAGGRPFGDHWRGGLLADHDHWVTDCLNRSGGLIDTAAVGRLWSRLRGLPRPASDTWCHNDLMPGNLLVEGGRLAGVIDVGTVCVADPAVDLQPAWNLFDAGARAAYRQQLGVDDQEWERGRGWALVQAAGCLWYYRESNPVMSETARRTLQALLDDERSGAT